MLQKYQLIEDVFDDLVSNGMSRQEAWNEILTNEAYSFYEYQEEVDSPQDALLLNVQNENTRFMLKMNNEMMQAFAKQVAIVF